MSYRNNYSYYGPRSRPCCETCGTSPCECIGGPAGMAGRPARAEASLMKPARKQMEADCRAACPKCAAGEPPKSHQCSAQDIRAAWDAMCWEALRCGLGDIE